MPNHLRTLYLVGLFLALFSFSGCALNAVAPQTFDEQVAYAKGSATAAYSTLAGLVERGSISLEKGQRLFDEIEQAEYLITVAQTVTDRAVAQEKLSVAISSLMALEAYLKKEAAK